MEKNFLTNAMNLAKEFCYKKIEHGDVVVDATMGNGNDTIFLSQLVGDKGKVYSFDVQESAIENTKRDLESKGIKGKVKLILDGHENMDKYVEEQVKLVMFNLGYLPKAEHRITTKANTTIKAIEKSLQLLQRNGMVVMVIYHGHEEGKEEKEYIYEFIGKLNQKEYNTIQLSFMNQVNNPPILVAIEKR